MRSAVARRLRRLRGSNPGERPQEVCSTWGWVIGGRETAHLAIGTHADRLR